MKIAQIVSNIFDSFDFVFATIILIIRSSTKYHLILFVVLEDHQYQFPPRVRVSTALDFNFYQDRMSSLDDLWFISTSFSEASENDVWWLIEITPLMDLKA